MNGVEFSEWIQSEIQQRDWSAIDLSKATKLDASYIYRVINKERSPGVEFCRTVAQAFKIPQQEVFVRAGLMDPPPHYDPDTARLLHRIASIPPEQRQLIEAMIDGLNNPKTKRETAMSLEFVK